MGLSQPEYWSGVPFPLPGELPNSGIEPSSPSCGFFTPGLPGKPLFPLAKMLVPAADAGKDWGQEGKGMTEDEMVGLHHRLNGHEFE